MRAHNGVEAEFEEGINQNMCRGVIAIEQCGVLPVATAKQEFVSDDVELSVIDRLAAYKDVALGRKFWAHTDPVVLVSTSQPW